MRTIYLKTGMIVALMIAGLSMLHAQTATYRSYFGNEFTHWYTFHEFFDVSLSEILYSIGKQDTLLSNGLQYKKFAHDYGGTEFSDNYYIGIREEVETGSLYVNTDGISEILVSKMDMAIGEKFYFPPPKDKVNNSVSCGPWYYFEGLQEDDKGYYARVDSIFDENNRKHIRLDVIYNAFFHPIRLTFIEGIGPNISFGPFLDFDYCWFNLCFICYENENVLWKNLEFIKYPENFTEGIDCLFNSMSNPEIKADFPLILMQRKNEIELRPGTVNFESGRIDIYSMHGILLYSKSVIGNAAVSISTSGFSKGSYIIILSNEKTKKSWSRKIVI